MKSAGALSITAPGVAITYLGGDDVPESKQCPRCGLRKSAAEFSRNRSRPDGLADWCRICNREYDRARRKTASRIAQSRDYERRRYWENRERERARGKEKDRRRSRRLRQAALDTYGRVCAHCGESEESKLDIDHVNEDGAQHRKEINYHLYQWLEKQGYPQDGRFQTLCRLCNVRKSWKHRLANR